MSYNQTMSQPTTCKAAWRGGKCEDAPGAARGLCQGHYAQWRRATDSGRVDVPVAYEPLRRSSGEGPTTVPLTIHVPPGAAEEYKAAAKAAGKKVSVLLRPWLEEGLKRHLAREEKRSPRVPLVG